MDILPQLLDGTCRDCTTDLWSCANHLSSIILILLLGFMKIKFYFKNLDLVIGTNGTRFSYFVSIIPLQG